MKKALSRKNLWEKTPRQVKSTVGRILSVVPPAWLLGKSFRANYTSLEEIQWWPAERSRQYQFTRLREILHLAYEKTTYYRRLLDSIGFRLGDFKSLEDIARIPTIDKHVVAENLPNMCTQRVDGMGVDFGSTGGTSGTPLHFYLNAGRSYIEYAYLTRSWERAGYKLGMPMAVLRGRIVPPDRTGLHHEYDPALRHHYYSSFHLSEESMAKYLKHIGTLGLCFLHVYPSTVTALTRFITRSGVKSPENIRGIIAESEIVYPEQRTIVEDAFGCRLFSCYGHSEKLILAAGCEKSDNYHVWPVYGYFELLDEKGDPVTTPGCRGEIVGTGFINTVMPFIRYRTGDWATYVGDCCEVCEREHTIIRDIRGHRIQEVLIAADGSEIPWTAMNMHDDTFLHVHQFQFLQETPGKAILRIVPAPGFGRTNTECMRRNLGRKCDGQLTFDIELVDAIPLSNTGKTIYVDQRIISASPRIGNE